MRSRPGSCPTSCANGRVGGGAMYGLDSSGPWVASSMTALSRTLMLTTWAQEKPLQPSPRSGPSGLRARLGFNPNTPDADAGIRIEPPPSLACVNGRMRDATTAPAPPEEPPDECARFQGLRVGPNSRDSVVGSNPNSGLELLPKIVTPVLRKRWARVLL